MEFPLIYLKDILKMKLTNNKMPYNLIVRRIDDREEEIDSCLFT